MSFHNQSGKTEAISTPKDLRKVMKIKTGDMIEVLLLSHHKGKTAIEDERIVTIFSPNSVYFSNLQTYVSFLRVFFTSKNCSKSLPSYMIPVRFKY